MEKTSAVLLVLATVVCVATVAAQSLSISRARRWPAIPSTRRSSAHDAWNRLIRALTAPSDRESSHAFSARGLTASRVFHPSVEPDEKHASSLKRKQVGMGNSALAVS